MMVGSTQNARTSSSLIASGRPWHQDQDEQGWMPETVVTKWSSRPERWRSAQKKIKTSTLATHLLTADLALQSSSNVGTCKLDNLRQQGHLLAHYLTMHELCAESYLPAKNAPPKAPPPPDLPFPHTRTLLSAVPCAIIADDHRYVARLDDMIFGKLSLRLPFGDIGRDYRHRYIRCQGSVETAPQFRDYVEQPGGAPVCISSFLGQPASGLVVWGVTTRDPDQEAVLGWQIPVLNWTQRIRPWKLQGCTDWELFRKNHVDETEFGLELEFSLFGAALQVRWNEDDVYKSDRFHLILDCWIRRSQRLDTVEEISPIHKKHLSDGAAYHGYRRKPASLAEETRESNATSISSCGQPRRADGSPALRRSARARAKNTLRKGKPGREGRRETQKQRDPASQVVDGNDCRESFDGKEYIENARTWDFSVASLSVHERHCEGDQTTGALMVASSDARKGPFSDDLDTETSSETRRSRPLHAAVRAGQGPGSEERRWHSHQSTVVGLSDSFFAVKIFAAGLQVLWQPVLGLGNTVPNIYPSIGRAI
ncbi:hypothetical protein B0H11DRAFT_1903174 [Mycena galericulata]|nr:hypothetical protein B0H11DRAFT_1903174 [Mycena galericulata]